MPTPRLRGTMLLASVLAATACTASTGKPASTEEAPPAPSEQVRELRLPLDTYTLTAGDNYVIEDAEDVLMRQCMRSKKYSWKLLPQIPRSELEPENRLRYGFIEKNYARYAGFHKVPDPPAVAERERVWDSRDRLPAAVQRAAYGSSGEGGCRKWAETELGSGEPAYSYHVINKLSEKSMDESLQHSKVKQATRSWSSCMRQSGFDYRNDLDLANDSRWQQTQKPSRTEVKAAEAEVHCKRKSGLVPIWFKVESQIQRNLIREHRTELERVKASKEHWLRAAHQVLDERGSP